MSNAIEKINASKDDSHLPKEEKKKSKSLSHKEDIKKKRLLTIQWSLGVGAVLLVGVTILNLKCGDKNNILLVFSVSLMSIITTLIGAVIGSSVE